MPLAGGRSRSTTTQCQHGLACLCSLLPLALPPLALYRHRSLHRRSLYCLYRHSLNRPSLHGRSLLGCSLHAPSVTEHADCMRPRGTPHATYRAGLAPE